MSDGDSSKLLVIGNLAAHSARLAKIEAFIDKQPLQNDVFIEQVEKIESRLDKLTKDFTEFCVNSLKENSAAASFGDSLSNAIWQKWTQDVNSNLDKLEKEVFKPVQTAAASEWVLPPREEDNQVVIDLDSLRREKELIFKIENGYYRFVDFKYNAMEQFLKINLERVFKQI